MQMRKRNIRTEISEYLEENANEVERGNGYDIADYLIKVKSGEAVLQSMTRKNPALKLLIETFDLELSDSVLNKTTLPISNNILEKTE